MIRSGKLLDDLEVVAVAVGDVAGVQAQVDVLRVGVGQELLDPVLGVDVGVGVRVEHQLHAVLLEDDPAELVGAGDQVRPLLGIDVAGLGGLAGVHVGVLLGQVDQVLRADLAEQLGLLAELGDRLVQGLFALVQPGEHRAATDLQAALVQFVAQLLRVLRQEALRAEFGPDVAGVLRRRRGTASSPPGDRPGGTRHPRSRAPCRGSAGTGRWQAVVTVVSPENRW